MTTLVACPACRRHIRIDHAACPFCATAVPADFASRVVPGARGRRLDRVATFTFAASLTVAACSGATTPEDTASHADAGSVIDGGGSKGDASVSDGGSSTDGGAFDDGSAIAMYGLPLPTDAGLDAADDGSAIAMYGLPLPTDAGLDAAEDGATDGSVKDGGGVQPLYGLPPGNAG